MVVVGIREVELKFHWPGESVESAPDFSMDIPESCGGPSWLAGVFV